MRWRCWHAASAMRDMGSHPASRPRGRELASPISRRSAARSPARGGLSGAPSRDLGRLCVPTCLASRSGSARCQLAPGNAEGRKVSPMIGPRTMRRPQTSSRRMRRPRPRRCLLEEGLRNRPRPDHQMAIETFLSFAESPQAACSTASRPRSPGRTHGREFRRNRPAKIAYQANVLTGHCPRLSISGPGPEMRERRSSTRSPASRMTSRPGASADAGCQHLHRKAIRTSNLCSAPETPKIGSQRGGRKGGAQAVFAAMTRASEVFMAPDRG